MSRHLLIPDVHQELAWAQAVLAREPVETPERVILLGDYFDQSSFPRRPAEADATAAMLKTWLAAGHRLLPGNHDAQYVERVAHPDGRRFAIPGCTQHADFALHFPDAAAATALFARVHAEIPVASGRTVLLTHAGLHEAHLAHGYAPEEAGLLLDAAWNFTQNSGWRHPHPLIAKAGRCRDGAARFTDTGGVLWRDHVQESSQLLLDQVCGHTGNHETVDIQRVVGPDGAIRHHICLDGRQSTYGVLDGPRLTVRACSPDGAELLFSAQLPCGFLQYLRTLTLDLLSGEITATAGRWDARGYEMKLAG